LRRSGGSLRDPQRAARRWELLPTTLPRAAQTGASSAGRAGSAAAEEPDGDEVVVRIEATPANPTDGPRPAGEVLAAAAGLARQASYPPSGEHQ
jgi:hypothetical protein